MKELQASEKAILAAACATIMKRWVESEAQEMANMFVQGNLPEGSGSPCFTAFIGLCRFRAMMEDTDITTAMHRFAEDVEALAIAARAPSREEAVKQAQARFRLVPETDAKEPQ